MLTSKFYKVANLVNSARYCSVTPKQVPPLPWSWSFYSRSVRKNPKCHCRSSRRWRFKLWFSSLLLPFSPV